MISKRIKNRPMMLTSHRLQMAGIAANIKAVPADKRTDQQKQILSDFQTEEKGILTSHDLQESKMPDSLTPEEQKALDDFRKKVADGAAEKIADKKAEAGEGKQHGKKKTHTKK